MPSFVIDYPVSAQGSSIFLCCIVEDWLLHFISAVFNLNWFSSINFVQEALYNIARACHHVGLVSLAASYYEKVLAIKEKDYPIPKHNDKRPDLMESGESGYCDLRREAAYNLHLIYKNSGAVDLARQLLKDYCTFWKSWLCLACVSCLPAWIYSFCWLCNLHLKLASKPSLPNHHLKPLTKYSYQKNLVWKNPKCASR